MALKESKDSHNGIVFKTSKNSLDEAHEYFRQLKQMAKEDFNKIFIVTEIKNKKINKKVITWQCMQWLLKSQKIQMGLFLKQIPTH